MMDFTGIEKHTKSIEQSILQLKNQINHGFLLLKKNAIEWTLYEQEKNNIENAMKGSNSNMNKRPMIAAIDFDGCLCENEYPKIGIPIYKTINMVLGWRKEGYKLILWTCRSGERLEEAIRWCKKFGIVFDAVNENLPEIIEYMGDHRKIFANVYLDDRAMDSKLI